MLVTIQQPENLPWLGLCNKVNRADLFIILDNVQFSKNNFQNRNRVLGPNGPEWLTVSIMLRGHTESTIARMKINNTINWSEKHWRTLQQFYSKHPYFAEHVTFFEETYAREWEYLADLNVHLIRYLFGELGIQTPMVKASELPVRGTKSELLAELCRAVGATAYLAGLNAQSYLDESEFSKRNIQVIYHLFQHPFYPQRKSKEFVSHLSCVDLLFNCGPESLVIITRGTRIDND